MYFQSRGPAPPRCRTLRRPCSRPRRKTSSRTIGRRHSPRRAISGHLSRLQVCSSPAKKPAQLHGLNLLPGSVSALPRNVKLPHMGWNQLEKKRSSSLLAGIGAGAYFYFAHSYAALASNGSTAATCCHGAEFSAVIEQRNIFAVQFHPEKSGDSGARVLRNFLELAA